MADDQREHHQTAPINGSKNLLGILMQRLSFGTRVFGTLGFLVGLGVGIGAVDIEPALAALLLATPTLAAGFMGSISWRVGTFRREVWMIFRTIADRGLLVGMAWLTTLLAAGAGGSIPLVVVAAAVGAWIGATLSRVVLAEPTDPVLRPYASAPEPR